MTFLNWLVRGENAEFVLGDLAEEAAARLRAGESPRAVRRWHTRQVATSAVALQRERFARRGPGRAVGGLGSASPRPSGFGLGGRPNRRDSGWRYAVPEALRQLRRTPGRAMVVVGIMGLGVGANATMFGTLDRLFFEPPAHIVSPDQVRRVFIHLTRMSGVQDIQSSHTYPDYVDWRSIEAFEETAAYDRMSLTVGQGAAAERVPTTLATASFFRLLGVRPVVGRFFGDDDDELGSDPVAVLGYRFWQRRFSGTEGAIGQTLEVGDQRYTVIGVAPEGFTGVDLERVDVWLPLHRAGLVEQGSAEWQDSRGWYWLQVIARLAPEGDLQAAEAAAELAHRSGRLEDPEQADYVERVAGVELGSLILARTGEASREARIVPWLMGVALMVLLLTCANVANLLLAWTLQRRRETAVRRALGASRARLLSAVVVESVLLAVLGGAAAIAVALWSADLFRATVFPGAGWERGADALRVVAFSAGLALLAGLLTGVGPAIRASRTEPADVLRGSGRGVTRTRSRLRSGLLVLQAAISVVLLVGTGLFVRSLSAARGVDLGFDPDQVLLVGLEAEGGYPGGEAMTGLYRDARRLLAQLAGASQTAISTTLPWQNSRGIGNDLRIPGLDSLPSTRSGGAYIHAVTGDYFEVSGLEIVRGRGITDADDQPTAPRVAVVNETMARLAWPTGDPLGDCLIIRDAPCATVVGIAEDSHRFELEEFESMHYYVPLTHQPYPWPPRGIMIKSASPQTLAPAVQRHLTATLSGVRLVRARPYRDLIDPTYRSWQLGVTLFAGFGLLALIVASIGLYSLLAFDIAERRREMGLRAALGASQGRIIRYVIVDGVGLAGIGIALGLVIGYVAGPRAEAILFGVSPRDPVVLVTAAIAMVAVSAVACGFPAWRASRVDPNETLRAE